MMAFRFPLAAVLMVRENAEKREELALEKIQREMVRISRLMDELTAEIAAAHGARDEAMQKPIPAFELQAFLGKAHQAGEKKKTLLQHLQVLQQERDRQMKVYQTARRDREALTNMLQEQREAYEYEQTRSQQKQLDDIFIARRQRRQD